MHYTLSKGYSMDLAAKDRPFLLRMTSAKCIVCLLVCGAFILPPLTAPAESDWRERIVSCAVDLRDQAAQAVERAEKRVAVAEADRSAAQGAMTGAKLQGNAEAQSIAGEAMTIAEDEARLASQLLTKARAFLAERNAALAHARRSASSKSSAARGMVLSEKGAAQRFAPDGNPITDPSQPLRAGERVTTGPEAQARLFVSKGAAEIGLQGSSSMTLQKDDDAGFTAELELGLARIKAMVGKWANKKFSVRTPSAVLAVRGTEFMVAVSQSTTTVTVFEGSVVVTPSSGKEPVTLKPGESAAITPDGVSRTVPSPGDVSCIQERGSHAASH